MPITAEQAQAEITRRERNKTRPKSRKLQPPKALAKSLRDLSGADLRELASPALAPAVITPTTAQLASKSARTVARAIDAGLVRWDENDLLVRV